MSTSLKAIYVIVNAGFSEEVVQVTRECGARGATILSARGSGSVSKSIFGITIDSEKEIILSIVDEETAEKIVLAIKEKAGINSHANGICFVLPVDKMIGINSIQGQGL